MKKRGYKAISMAAVVALAVGITACGSKMDKKNGEENADGVTVTFGAEATKNGQEEEKDVTVTETPEDENVQIVYDTEQEIVALDESEKFYYMADYEDNDADTVDPYDAAKFVKSVLIADDNYGELPDYKVRAYSYEGIVTVNGERCFLMAQGEDDSERYMVVNRYAVGTGENAKIYYDDMVTCMYQEVAEIIDDGNGIRLIEDGEEFDGVEEDAME